MPKKKTRRRRTAPQAVAPLIKPLIKPLIRPIVEPIVTTVQTRLDEHEELLRAMKDSLDIQFKRIAEMQAQIDQLLKMQRRQLGVE